MRWQASRGVLTPLDSAQPGSAWWHSRSDRDLSAEDWQLTGQPAERPITPTKAQHGDEVLEAGGDNYEAVAAHRLSAEAGNPLSERKLAQMFGRTSRRWARARIADARQSVTGCPTFTDGLDGDLARLQE